MLFGFWIGREKLPDNLLAHGGGLHLIAPVDCSEGMAPSNAGGGCPCVDRNFYGQISAVLRSDMIGLLRRLLR